jgi:hypothetical protein
MITFLIYAIILLLMFQFRNINNYVYIRKCFKIICNDAAIQHHYRVVVDEEEIKNPRKTFLNTLYFYVIVPGDMPYQYVGVFLNGHMKMINEIMLHMDLIGLVNTDKHEFKYKPEDKEEIQYRHIVKYRPDIKFFKLSLWIFYFVTLITTWFAFKFFNLSVYFSHEMIHKFYITLFN